MRSKSGPGGTLYRYGFCEVAQRQAVLLRKDKPSDRAIKSDRAKVVMTAGCISKNCGIINYTCREKERTRQIRISVIFYLEALCKLPNIFLLMISVRLIICLENDIIIVK